MKNVGLVLIVLGLVMTVFTGFTLITKKNVVDVGPVQIDRKEKTPIYWSPITGVVILAAGAVVFLLGRKNS